MKDKFDWITYLAIVTLLIQSMIAFSKIATLEKEIKDIKETNILCEVNKND